MHSRFDILRSTPAWRCNRSPLVAMVVVASVVLSALLCILLVNRAKSMLLMEELKVGGKGPKGDGK